MASVAVVHPDLGALGGAESVCMHTLAALQDDHELVLYTLTRPDLSDLNEFFETGVDPRAVDVAVVGHLAPRLRRHGGNRLVRLQAALLGRSVRRRSRGLDLVVSTKNEFAFDAPSLQYVHHPQFAGADPGLTDRSVGRNLYDEVCRRLAGVEQDGLPPSTGVLANSEWTADLVRETYGVQTEPVYPPVDAQSFPDVPWESREAGIVTAGRVGPSKRLLENVAVVDELRDRGHDVHLHIAGPSTDDEYCDRVKRAAEARAYVSFEGAVDRETLVDLFTGHRYGLHGRPHEHFGIVVAEMVAAGVVPFAPDSGGQREILGGDPRLLYETTDDAVAKMDRVLSAPDGGRELRADLPSAERRFGTDRFESRIRDLVAEAVSP